MTAGAVRVMSGAEMNMTATKLPASRGALTGIALKVTSVLIFLVMSSLLKASQGVPAGELVFFRSFFGVLPVVAFVAWRGELRGGLKSNHVVSQIWRGLVGTVSMGLGFFALTRLPLPEAVTINYAMPLIIVIFSAIFLRETVRAYRWTAVIVGLVGVVIIAWPQLTLFSGGVNSAAAVGALAAIGGATMGAVAQLLVRTLIRTERSGTIVLYFLLSSSAISLLTVPFGWVVPSPLTAVLLVGAGIAGGIAQVVLTESYRHADMSVVAPFEYTSLVFSVIIGFLFFGDVPTWFMLVGGVIVVGSGLFIIYREHRLGLDQSKVREVVTPQG
jgi:drug/metabolite transporter (DMT)-like permease